MHRRLSLPAGIALVFALAILVSVPGIAGAASHVWAPASIPAEDLADRTDLLFEGMSGRLVLASPETAADLALRGAQEIQVREGEVLFVFLCEDALRAEFATPARILIREGREVLLATAGETPRLTAESAAELHGLKQAVRIQGDFIPWVTAVEAPAAPAREVDPLVQSMVNALTQANYDATWQALDDFETRYTYAPENELASQWMLQQFQSFGLQAEFHYYSQSGTRRNVVATHPGMVDPSRVVYIVGHFDSISEDSYVCAPGADDNASGTAAVIEAARVLSQYLFDYTIKFVCFNGEEQGLYGSAAYCNDIANQGEDVIGAFNLDMIAYRGTDPDPADLVIYTNSNSQSLAATLSQAINDYTPGEIEAVVRVESMSGSDHSSFWNEGWKAICAIEDEAWGNDFCPWYHTCEDKIERYPHDYPLSCARANLAAVAITAGPLNPNGPYLVYRSSVIDDDNTPPSSGDGDGTINPGETVELWVTVENVGTATATNVSGSLVVDSGEADVLDGDASWNNIPAGSQGTNTSAFLFEIGGTASDGDMIALTLTITDDSGSRDLPLSFPVVAPNVAYYFHSLTDSNTGNSNGVMDPGEVVELNVMVTNTGGKDASNIELLLASGSGHLNIVDGQAVAGSVPMGGVIEVQAAFQVAATGDAVEGEVLLAELTAQDAFGYAADSQFKLKVGALYFDDVESSRAWSLEAPDDDAETGRWEQDDPIGTQQDGQPCQPEDDHTPTPGTDCFFTGQGAPGGAAGGADIDNGKTTLTTPSFDLTLVQEPRVTYWRWYTNNLGNSPNEDYWVVQVSSNGGTSWVDLERTTASANYWQEKSFLLDGYITPTSDVIFRFVASDEGSGSLVEAAVDDFEITGAMSPVDVAETEIPAVLRLYPARPSPSAGPTTIAFGLPEAGRARLEIFDVAGRKVATLADGSHVAGVHQISWDGAAGSGHRVAPGVYFYRLSTEDQSLSRRLVILE